LRREENPQPSKIGLGRAPAEGKISSLEIPFHRTRGIYSKERF